MRYELFSLLSLSLLSLLSLSFSSLRVCVCACCIFVAVFILLCASVLVFRRPSLVVLPLTFLPDAYAASLVPHLRLGAAPLVRVQACFGGFAIFRTASLLQAQCSYASDQKSIDMRHFLVSRRPFPLLIVIRARFLLLAVALPLPASPLSMPSTGICSVSAAFRFRPIQPVIKYLVVHPPLSIDFGCLHCFPGPASDRSPIQIQRAVLQLRARVILRLSHPARIPRHLYRSAAETRLLQELEPLSGPVETGA